MVTDDEALAAIDPSLPSEERLELARRVKASSAALDAYYDSRPELERILALAQGHNTVAPVDSGAKGAGQGAAVTAGGDAPAIETAVVQETPEEQEMKDLEARIAALRAKKGA